MASSLALKRLVVSSSNLFPSYLRTVRPVVPSLQSASRLFNTNALRDSDDDDRRRSNSFDACNLGFPETLLGGVKTTGLRRGWDANETDDVLHFWLDMPGLGKEDVKVSVENDSTLIIKGEQGEKVSDGEESRGKFTGMIDVSDKQFKTGEIKAEMKNGVLKLVVPKVKEDERSDVFHVKID